MKGDEIAAVPIDGAVTSDERPRAWWQAGWLAVYLREMLLFRRKVLRPGYVLSAMVVPVMYLVVFGFGLGRSVQVRGTSYLSFLLPGLVAMSAMTNSYSWVANSLNLHRLYFKTFQSLIQAPISPMGIMLGEVLSGATKGLFAALMLILPGLFLPGGLRVGPLFVGALLLTCFAFASLGVVVGMMVKTHEDAATYNNFFITPMAFFGGTFFPVEAAPAGLRAVMELIPLTHATRLLRATGLEGGVTLSVALLALFAAVLFLLGARMIARYDE